MTFRLRLRHFLHPLRAFNSLKYRIELFRTHKAAERKINLRRDRRDRCWCGGKLKSFEWHSSYKVCVECGCYVNIRPPFPEELAKVYEFDNYWHYRQAMKGFPTIEDRAAQDQTDGRLQRWLEVIEKYHAPGASVIEIGCAHGTLLAELAKRGYTCVGVEVDPKSAEWTHQATGLDIRAGIFPGIPLPMCDIFMAYDVLEHSICPDKFMAEAAHLLKPGGIIVIQTPVYRHETPQPFMQVFDHLFDDVEHLFLFSVESRRLLAEHAGLEIIGEEYGVIEKDVTIFRAK